MATLVQYGQLKFNKGQSFSYSGTSAQSSALDSKTVAVRISAQNDSDKIALFDIGTNPTATNSSIHIGTHKSSEYHDTKNAWIEFFIDRGTDLKIAFKSPASNSGKAQIIELKY